MALKQASELGTPGIQELLLQALEVGGSQAADLLMAPVAATFPFPDHRDRADTLLAVEALVRAGGDPTPALPMLVQALDDRHSCPSALGALRRAALAGRDLTPIRPQLEALVGAHPKLQTVCRVAFLEHPERASRVQALERIHRSQPVGNLREGIGLVEQLLGSEDAQDRALAESALEALLQAGKDLYATWFALLPVLRRVLAAGTPAQQRDALHTLEQFRYTPAYAQEHSEAKALERALPTLEAVLPEVVPHLKGSASWAAAQVVRVWARLGVSLAGVRESVEAGLEHDHVAVRSGCSEGLTLHLRRTGEEPELPADARYRRTFARSDEPVDDGAPRECALCGAREVRLIYSEDDGAQFYRVYTSERHCSACDRYFPEVFQAPG